MTNIHELLRDRQGFERAEGVVFIGVAQEKANAFKGRKKDQSGWVGFDYSRVAVNVNHYYFYLQDAEFGPAFIKVCRRPCRNW